MEKNVRVNLEISFNDNEIKSFQESIIAINELVNTMKKYIFRDITLENMEEELYLDINELKNTIEILETLQSKVIDFY